LVRIGGRNVQDTTRAVMKRFDICIFSPNSF